MRWVNATAISKSDVFLVTCAADSKAPGSTAFDPMVAVVSPGGNRTALNNVGIGPDRVRDRASKSATADLPYESGTWTIQYCMVGQNADVLVTAHAERINSP